MNRNATTEAARSNLAAVERRALKLHACANQLRDDPATPVGVRQNANTASMASAVAWLMARSGRAASAGAGLAAAELAHSEARAALLRPYAKRGVEFPPGRETSAATDAHTAAAKTRREIVIRAIRKILSADQSGKYLHAGGAKAGEINGSKLAKFYVEQETTNAPLSERSVRAIVKKAISEKVLA